MTPATLAADKNNAITLTMEQREELRGISQRLEHWNPEFVLTMLEVLMQRGELEVLRQFKNGALLMAQAPGTLRAEGAWLAWGKRGAYGDWSGLPLTAAGWLHAQDPALREFAQDWLQTFVVDPVNLPLLAQRELLREIAPDRGKVPFNDLRSGMRTKDGTTFDLARAQRLVELAVPSDDTPASALEDVIDKLLAPDRPNSSEKTLAHDAAVLAHIVHLDAQAHPENPTKVLTDGEASNLMVRAMSQDKPQCLIAMAGVFGETSTAFRTAFAEVFRELSKNTILGLDPFDTFSLPILRGWLDADMANMILLSNRNVWEKLPGEAEEQMVLRSYGRDLAESRKLMPQTLELLRQLKAAGGDLDALSTAGETRAPALEWTATLLHHAVVHGTPDLVQFLLVEMNCDPFARCTIRNLNTGRVRERDCFELIKESGLAGSRVDQPDWDARSQAVDEMLRAWRAHRHANDALVKLLDKVPSTKAP